MDVRYRKNIFVLMVLPLMISCSGSPQEIPKDILTEGQMVDLLIDIRIAEGKVGTLSLGSDSSRNLYRILEKKIFEDHGVDTATYIKSHQYYLLNPERAMNITGILIDSLKVRQQRLTPKSQ